MIFNKNSTGAAELKSLLGFIYKSSNFANMVSFIGFGEREIRKIISDAVFDTAEAHYQSENYLLRFFDTRHPEYLVLDNLVSVIQLPVALHAYRRYAVQNDLGHSDKGRFITVTETEKPAFEWMIDKSDKSMLELAHEATDLLLEFLDRYIDYLGPGGEIVIPWRSSAQCSSIRELFITKDQFNNEFSINGSRRVFLSLVPFIRNVQTNEILACLGRETFDSIYRVLLDGIGLEHIEPLLIRIRPALCFLALARAVIRLSVEILPDGLFTNFITGTIHSKAAASIPLRVQVSQSLHGQGLAELSKLQQYLNRLAIERSGETYTAVDPAERIDPLQKFVRL